MTADERLALIRVKAKWADKHFAGLETELNAFRESKPYKVNSERDVQTRKTIYRLIDVKPTPEHISLMVGDVLQALRSTLDHLAYQLMLIGKPTGFNPDWAKFPIGKDLHGYQSLLGRVKQNGMRQSAIDAITDVEPYGGGKGALLWALHNLNNIDKHRLILTTFVQTAGIDITPDSGLNLEPWAERLVTRLGPSLVDEVTPRPPAKAGDILFVGAPDEETYGTEKFIFEVGFAEPGVIEGKPISPTLREMATRNSSGLSEIFEQRAIETVEHREV